MIPPLPLDALLTPPPLPPEEIPTKKLSASQVEAFAGCQRKWGFTYLEGFRFEASSARLGSRVHAILEDYQIHGVMPDPKETLVLPQARTGEMVTNWPGQIAQAGLHLLPPPGVVDVEGAFKCETSASVWQGRKDGRFLRDPKGAPTQTDAFAVKHPGFKLVVQDHKTTGNKAFAKTAEDLLTDTQAILYAWSEMEEWGIDEVHGEWIYYSTKAGRPEAWRVTQVFTRAHVVAQIQKLDAIAREVHRVYKISPKPRALDLPPTASHCEAYGGCPHRNTCNLSIGERIDAMQKQETLTELLARKKRDQAQLENGSAPPLVAPEAAPPLPAAPPAPPAAPPLDPRPDATPELAATFAALHAQGHTVNSLANHYNVNVGSVNRAIPAQPTAAPALPPLPPPAPVAEVPAAPVAEAPAAPAPAAPTGYWNPSMPMDEGQTYLRNSKNKPWSFIAMASDVPVAVAETYDTLYDEHGKPTKPPEVERAHINPPEAPQFAPAHPGEMPPPPAPKAEAAPVADDLDALDREALKALAISYGCVNESSRIREAGLREMIRAARAEGKEPEAPPASKPNTNKPNPSITVDVVARSDMHYAEPAIEHFEEPFLSLAQTLFDALPNNVERGVSLRKLLEAQDAANRAAN